MAWLVGGYAAIAAVVAIVTMHLSLRINPRIRWGARIGGVLVVSLTWPLFVFLWVTDELSASRRGGA